MEAVANFIGMEKTNTKGLCNENIEKITKYWPGGSYLVEEQVYGTRGQADY